MFSTTEFIDASRSFVCIRIETYENKESEEKVRSLLNGRLANTVFCMFNPEGTRRLSRAGSSPTQVMGRGASDINEGIIDEMKQVASRYEAKATDGAVLQDFLSFRQALNVASADQRLLVFVNGEEAAVKELMPTLQKLFADEEVVGRFHLDILGDKDTKWVDAIKGAKSKPAINIIQAGKFGLDGTLMSELPLDSSLEQLKEKLLAENKKFGSTEDRKVYADHVMEGKRKGINFETEIPYGEDRDGDGEIDRSRRGRRGGAGRNGRGESGRGGAGRGRSGRGRGK